MSLPVSIITPSFSRDFEACRLLCETIDTYVTGLTDHYVVVTKSDLELFRPLAGPRRHIVPEATLLPGRLHSIPIKWKGRRYRWTPGALPVYGWHVQQLLKFAMALSQNNPRVMFIDSDNFFVRPFDLAAFAGGETVPLQVDREAVVAGKARHAAWLETAHRLLGLPAPDLPADDFIGQMIVWDVETMREILRRVETNAGEPWWKALIRARAFSEYMIYGAAVTSDPALGATHRIVTEHPCRSYWEGPAMGERELKRFAAGLRPDQSALGVQSFTGTPIELLRAIALPEDLAA
jgi:hypothetical protein